MSALWTVEVLALDGTAVDLGVRLVHPDSGPFPRSPVFVLRVLHEPSQGFDDALDTVALGPLGEVAAEDVADEEWASAHAADYVSAVTVDLDGPDRVDDAKLRQRITVKLRAGGMAPGEPRWDDAFDAESSAFWADTAALPYARYHVTVSDARWLAHLAVGKHWRSAAWA